MRLQFLALPHQAEAIEDNQKRPRDVKHGRQDRADILHCGQDQAADHKTDSQHDILIDHAPRLSREPQQEGQPAKVVVH